jgi:EPS-associated MarR family transcriptional regulator
MSDIQYRVLKVLESNPNISQRDMAKELGISLGKTNYVLKALINRGFVKLNNFKKSNNKIGYAYKLTPEGITNKSKLAKLFLQNKIREFEILEIEIEKLKKEFD